MRVGLPVLLLALPACGGCEGGGSLMDDGAVFRDGVWTRGPHLQAPRAAHAVVAVGDAVYVLGGEAHGQSLHVERCDLGATTCEDAGLLTHQHRFGDAVALETGEILVAPGVLDSGYEIFDPRAGTSTPTGTGTDDARLVVLRDGRVLAVGTSKTWIFSPRTRAWDDGPALLRSRYGVQATLLDDDRVFVSGGACSDCERPELIDLAGSPSELRAPMRAVRSFHVAAQLADGRVLLVGGAEIGEVGAELYDPATDRWEVVGGPEHNRLSHTGVLLSDGRVLVTGGLVGSDLAEAPTDEIFLPTSASWSSTPTPDALRWREYHAMLALPDGSAIVLGGDTGYLEGTGSSPR